MKKIIVASILCFATNAFAFEDVLERLPGVDTSGALITQMSSGAVAGVSISTITATLVMSVASMPGYNLAETIIQNQSSSQNIYCGHVSNTNTSGPYLGIKIGYGEAGIFKIRKELPIYCKADGASAVTCAVAFYGHK